MPISSNLSFDDLMEYKKYCQVCRLVGAVPINPVAWFEKYRPGTIVRT